MVSKLNGLESCKRICKRAQCGSMRPNAVLCGLAGVNRGSVYPLCACMRSSDRLLRPSRLPFRHFGAASDYSGAHCAGSACRTRCERLTHKMPREIVSQSWRMELERKTGFEPATFSLARRCSTPEPLPPDCRRRWRWRCWRQGPDSRWGRLGTNHALSNQCWCRGPDSNWGHQHFQCCALPTELPRPVQNMLRSVHEACQADGDPSGRPWPRCGSS